MRNQPENSFASSRSPTSIRDTFDDEIIMVRPIDDLPFDEPPHSGMRRGNPSRKYSLDGYSFYQSSAQIDGGYIVENRPIHISQRISKKPDPSTSLMHRYHSQIDDDCSSDAYGSDSENSDISSFFNSFYEYPASESDSASDFDNSQLSECHHCDAMVVNFQKFLGLPVSNYRSKPLPKPILWKSYTCFKGKCPDECPAATEEKEDSCDKDNVSLRKYENWHRNEGRTKFCNDVLSVDDTASEITSNEASEFFQVNSLLEYLDCAKISAHDLLKRSIFVDDPEHYTLANVVVDDSDSITNGSTI